MSINNREFERFSSPAGKWVKLIRKDSPLIYQLIDLSQGGMSFISLEEDEFRRNDKIVVIEFRDKKLTEPLVGIVRYVEENFSIEDAYMDYKVGVEFLKTK